jgi:hypothetical protein
VQQWQTNLPATPMVASVVSAMHLPTTIPFATFEAQLKAQGSDLAAGLRILSTSLTAAEKTKLAALTATPIPLQYFYASQSKLLNRPHPGRPRLHRPLAARASRDQAGPTRPGKDRRVTRSQDGQ